MNEVKAAHVDWLMAMPGVVGVAVGKDGEADVILVMVESLTPDNDAPRKLGLPADLEGFPLQIREVGRLEAQPN